MLSDFLFSFKPGISVLEDGNDLLIVDEESRALRLVQPDPSLRHLIACLKGGEHKANDDNHALSQAEILYRFLNKGFLCLTWLMGDKRLATLEASASYRSIPIQPEGQFRLSRFAVLRRENDDMLMESGLGHARLLIYDERLSGWIMLLARPRSVKEWADIIPLPQPSAFAFLWLLVNVGAVFACDEEGKILEERDTALRQWEWHDLVFHTKSRGGRHTGPSFKLCGFLGEIPPQPAFKPPMSEERIPLPRPETTILSQSGPFFFEVVEARSSCRPERREPLSLDQLATFLHFTLGVRKFLPADPQQRHVYEASLRPCASGGALHPLEAYLSVSRAEGIRPGFYHYDGRDHVLEWLSPPNPSTQRLIMDASHAMGGEDLADVLLTLAARIPRVAWKYPAFAYALILKDTGCLFQQMYLVATALGLSPCAIGYGNAEDFAKASALDPHEECAVGEFVLSGKAVAAEEGSR